MLLMLFDLTIGFFKSLASGLKADETYFDLNWIQIRVFYHLARKFSPESSSETGLAFEPPQCHFGA